MSNCKALATSMISGWLLSKYDGKALDKESASMFRRSLVRAIQYCCITIPELVFFVNRLCQFVSKPLDTHWLAMKRVLRYLKRTSTLGLHFISSPIVELVSYLDADWTSCREDMHNVSAYCVFLENNLVYGLVENRRLWWDPQQKLSIGH